MYVLVPEIDHITVVPLKSSEIKEYTGKVLSDVETTGMDVLQFGRVVFGTGQLLPGMIVIYPKLASDKTNFGDPRQVIVEVAHIKAHLKEIEESQ